MIFIACGGLRCGKILKSAFGEVHMTSNFIVQIYSKKTEQAISFLLRIREFRITGRLASPKISVVIRNFCSQITG